MEEKVLVGIFGRDFKIKRMRISTMCLSASFFVE